jgi:predicted ATP-binding protein involved in virulence
MRVESINIRNFRGIEDARVVFDQRTTAFVGVNGVGKSTILDALAIVLSQLTWRISGHPLKARPIAVDDIRHGAEYARIEASVRIGENRVQWAVATNRRKGTYPDVERKSDLDALNESVKWLLVVRECIESDAPGAYSLPLAVYYDVNRAVLDIPVRVREKLRNSPSEVYQDALDHGGADFKRFFIWFRNREDVENEQRRDQSGYRDRALEAVRRAVAAFTGFEELRIRRNPLRMTVMKNGLEFNVAQLSDGERNMLALVGDMARRLSVLNPGLANPNDGDGVVLIDEIDLHLHPKWQREVVAKLERTFPRCQFIVTTHSPQVVGELAAESVMLLRDGKLLGRAPRSLGMSSNTVLEELMEGGGRNHRVNRLLKVIHRLLETERIADARRFLDRLQAKVGDIPEVIEAQASIRTLEWLEDESE